MKRKDLKKQERRGGQMNNRKGLKVIKEENGKEEKVKWKDRRK